MIFQDDFYINQSFPLNIQNLNKCFYHIFLHWLNSNILVSSKCITKLQNVEFDSSLFSVSKE